MCNRTIISFSFCDIRNNQGLIKSQVLSVSAFGLADIRLTLILIIPDITKTESNLPNPKTHQVYPKKWNTVILEEQNV